MRRLIPLFIIMPGFLHAQNQLPTERALADRLPERFYLDVPTLRRSLIARIPAEHKTDRKDDLRNFRFADAVSFNVAEMLKSGYVYSDWQELEDLMNGILRKVWPSEMADTSSVHAYLVRDAEVNAFMTGTGQMFIHIGLIDEVQDESTLAAVLCHELAHHHLRHSYQKFRDHEVGECAGHGGAGGFPGDDLACSIRLRHHGHP
jgi:predicted Zn-dependent protease